ncbi:MAG: DUF2079 domain-containing protein, partial [Candidatus Methylomirabilis sp.]|nr:DUF2079 domain-containing protein [Deltaproteobacteria bacterium]
NTTRPQVVFTLLAVALLNRAGGWRKARRGLLALQAIWLGLASAAFIAAQFFIEDSILGEAYAAKVFHLEGFGATTGGALETLLFKPAEVLARAWSPANAAWLATLLLPTLGLALLAPRLVLAAAPFLAFTLVTTARQSGAEALIAVFYAAAAYGAARLLRERPRLSAPLAAGVLAASLGVHWALTPADLGPVPLTRHWDASYYAVTDHDRRSLAMLGEIPEGASVMAHHVFIAHMVARPRVGQFPSDALRDYGYEYVIVDFTKAPRRRDHRREFFEGTLRVLRELDYGVARFEDGVMILKKGADRAGNAEALRRAAEIMARSPVED